MSDIGRSMKRMAYSPRTNFESFDSNGTNITPTSASLSSSGSHSSSTSSYLPGSHNNVHTTTTRQTTQHPHPEEEIQFAWVLHEDLWWPAFVYSSVDDVFLQFGQSMSTNDKNILAFEVLKFMKRREPPIIARLDDTFLVVSQKIDFYQNLSKVISQMDDFSGDYEMYHKWQRCLGIIYEALEKNVQTFQEIPPNHHPEDDTDNVTAVTSGTRFNECDLSTIDMYTLADAGVVREDVYQNQETHSIRLPRVAFRPPSPVQPNKSSESKKRPATPTYPNTNHDDKDKGRYWGPGKRCKTIKPKETPTQEHQVPDHNDDDSDAFYEWENLWNRHLVPDGWYCIRDNLYDPNSDGWSWIPPHNKDAVGKAEKNRDYFTTKEQVQQWCRTHNYKAKASGKIEEEVQEQEQKQSSQQESPGTQGMSSLEYDGSVPSTPESPRTRPQDPGLPQLPEEDEDDPYSWKILWPKLKELGWYHKPGKGLVSFLYIRPGKKVQGGKLGVDYFNSEVDVIAYEKKTDFVDTNEAEADDMVNTASASNPDSEIEDSHVSSSSSIASSSSSTVCTHAEDEWWRESRLPDFKQDIWPALQKLNFYYSTSYRLPKNAPVPKGQHSSFPDTHQLQQFLAKAGIPNWEKMRNLLTKRERIKIDCWVKFANVPVKPSSITEELGKIKVINDTQATKLLKKCAFKEIKEKFVHTETNESFASLKDVQSYIRGLSESMKGRRRKSTDPSEVEDELKLRLWAALSPSPLPRYPGAN